MQDNEMSNSSITHKRYKQEQRLEQEMQSTSTKNVNVPFFTRKLRAEVERVWHAPEHDSKNCCLREKEEKSDDMKVVPAFKVGTLEMYKRFPDAYDALMKRHDCSAIQEYLHNTILPRLLSSRRHKPKIEKPIYSLKEEQEDQSVESPTSLFVIDVGCGTGRIASMLAQSPHVKHIFAYDNALPMLQRCAVNVAKSVASSSVSNYSSKLSAADNSICACKGTVVQNVNNKREKQAGIGKLQGCHESCALCIEYMSASHKSSEELHCSELFNKNNNEQDNHTSLTALPSSNLTNYYSTAATTEGKELKEHLHNNNNKIVDDARKTLHLQLCSYHDIQEGYFTRHAHPHVSLIVCAWSLSYVMRESWNDTCKWQDAVRRIITELIALLETTSKTSTSSIQQQKKSTITEEELNADNSHGEECTSALVIIETLGTNSIGPSRQNVMMEWLVEEFGFELKWVQTDYHFSSVAEAVRLTNFFFGSSMSELMAKQQTELQSSAT